MNKRFLQFSFIAVIALFITLVSLQGISLTASTDGEIDGELTSKNYNNRASVTNFVLKNATGNAIAAGGSIDPNTDLTAEVTITDPDTIDDLNSVKFYFHYEDGGNGVSSPGALSLDLADETDNTGSIFVAEWTLDSGSVTLISEGGSSFTWSLNSYTVPSSTSDFEGTDFTFVINFTVSKVADFSSDADWFFGTSINDGKESLESGSDENDVVDKALKINTGSTTDDSFSGFKMAFYGEINLSQTNISWSGVRAGDAFNSVTSDAILTDTTYISNAPYDTRIKSSAEWDAVITEEKVNDVLSGSAVDNSTSINDFTTRYNTDFPQNKLSTTGAISDLIGAPYANANTVINSISGSSVSWASIDFLFLLPQPSNDANLVGATLITDSGVIIDSAGFTEQFFMIGYDERTLTNTHTLTIGPTDYALLGTGDDWRQFLPDTNNAQNATDEDGDTNSLTLFLYLSSVFQNAQYSGTISLQITNNP